MKWVLDLCDPSAVRVCCWRGGKPWLWGEVAVPAGATDARGVVRDPPAVGAAIRRLLDATGRRPEKVWVVLPPMAAVEQAVRVPPVWPWERKVATDSLARRQFGLNPRTALLRVRWRGMRTAHLVAILKDALGGALAALRVAGLSVAGGELVSGVLARIAVSRPVVQVTRAYILVVAAGRGLPLFSAWAVHDTGVPLAPQVLRLLNAARQEAGDRVMPGEGPLALVGVGAGDPGLADALTAAGWTPRPVTVRNLPAAYLPGHPDRPAPLNLIVRRRNHAPLASAVAAAAGAAILTTYAAIGHMVLAPAERSAAASLAQARTRFSASDQNLQRMRQILANDQQWAGRLAGIRAQQHAAQWVAVVNRVKEAASAAGASVDHVTLTPGDPAAHKAATAEIVARASALDAVGEMIQALKGTAPFGKDVRLASLAMNPQGITFTLQAAAGEG